MTNVESKRLNWNILSIYRSELMGAAIIWIMLLHGVELFPHMLDSVLPLNFIFKHGSIGVEMFLIVSGIGLFYSLSKKDDLKQFYINRIVRVIVPYLILSVPFWVWQDLWVKRDAGQFILDISLLSFWTQGVYKVWYVALIIILYAVFPFIFRAFLKDASFKKKSALMVISLILPFIFYAVVPAFFARTDIAIWRVPSFILGSVLSFWVMSEHKFSKMQIVMIALATAGAVVFVVTVGRIVDISGLFRLAYLPAGLICCLAVGMVLKILNCGWLNWFLSRLGSCSLELYLVPLFLRSIFKHYMPKNAGYTHIQEAGVWGIIMVLSIGISVLSHKYFVKLNRKAK